MSVTLKHEPMNIPTYAPHKANTLPFFLEKKAYQGATGRIYPVPYTDRLSNEPKDQAYDAYTLENEHIRVVLLPELGGKIHGAVDKHNGYEFIYQNTVIKPAMVGIAGPWVSGGVEFNWPQHHRPTTFHPMEATPRKNPDGSVTVWMGEAEPFYRMRGMVGITVYPGCSCVEAKAVVYNRTDVPLPFMWWNNLAVRVHEQYKATFPPDVAYGNDHDRRAVVSFPVMKGVYKTARPFDYGEGTDATWFSNIKLPTSVMIMRDQSHMDFVGGYDFAADAGTITVSDHHMGVGKKMWTWGDGPFGNAWAANLTDNGDRYIELMTGVYTDNQPDFTYIMPGETKVFSQVWYPIHSIGEVKNASMEGAVSLEIENGTARFGALTTRAQKGAKLSLKLGDAVLFEQQADLSPARSFTAQCALPEGFKETDLRLELIRCDGRVLVGYRPPVMDGKEAPRARPIPPDPADVGTIEELYLHGAHLEQYKHHTYVPADYYLEALRREPEDLRCNLSMGRLCMEKGAYADARAHLDKAIARLKMRNCNPEDTQALYLKARLERLEGRIDEAYALFYDAAWQYAWRSPSYYEIACIDCLRGERAKAIEHLRLCLETNMRHYTARALIGYLTKDADALRAILDEAPQDGLARFCLHLVAGEPLPAFLLGRSEDMTDIALDLRHAGLNEEAAQALRACTAPSQMLLYHLADITGADPEHTHLTYCFPNRLRDIPALSRREWQAQYLLGCLYYDRMNYPAAISAWQAAQALKPDDAFTKRCLAQALFDHGGKPEQALELMRAALSLAPDNARILYELLQMKKNMGFSVKDRLALLERHESLARERDDCFLDSIVLYTQDGQYQKARELLLSKRFNIYEGGEGKLTRHHGWLYALLAHRAMREGNPQEALRHLETARVYPKNYGEGRHYSAQEGNIYYFTGLACEALGHQDKAREAYAAAAAQPGQITEMIYFTGAALDKLGKAAEARAAFEGMVKEGRARLESCHRWGYFGVGMPSPLPSELDIERMNKIDAYLLMLLGNAGLGQPYAQQMQALKALDPYNTKLDFFQKLELV
jgi:tetratricopeptide (TPR) repeat protein